MRTRPLVVRTRAGHQPVQARFVEHDHVVEALATSGSHESLDEGILPRRPRRREHFLNPHRRCRGPQRIERMIAIVNQESRRLVPRKGLAQLLGRPCRCRLRGDRDVPNASPIVGEAHQDEQQAGGRRRDHEEIGRHDLAAMIPQERAPGLRAGAGGPCISRRSPSSRRSRVSAVRHGSAARPHAGLPGRSRGSARGRRQARSVARGGAGSSLSTRAGNPVGATRSRSQASR